VSPTKHFRWGPLCVTYPEYCSLGWQIDCKGMACGSGGLSSFRYQRVHRASDAAATAV
jgi:hypothetical protein